MKVMVIVKATPGSEAGELPSQELLTEMMKYNEELVNAGIMLAGEGLQPSSRGARVRFSGTNRTVTDGPFPETKELIAGYWLWRVDSLEEAIAWVKKCPNPMMEDSDIEIRPLFEMEDFGDNATPEVREQEALLRAKTLGLEAPRFEDGRELKIAGLKQSYTSETRPNIPRQWETFAPQMNSVPGRVGPESYGVCWKQNDDCDFEYLTGVEVRDVDDLPEEYSHTKLQASRYIVFPHSGHVSAIADTLDTLWTKWAPDAGLPIQKAPWFERYTENFDPLTMSKGIEFWIPIESD